jgi:MFS family permease
MTVAISVVPKNQSNMGTYMGMGMAVMSFAVLIGPPIGGELVSRYGGYDEVSYFSGAFTVVGALGVIVCKYASGKGMLSMT